MTGRQAFTTLRLVSRKLVSGSAKVLYAYPFPPLISLRLFSNVITLAMLIAVIMKPRPNIPYKLNFLLRRNCRLDSAGIGMMRTRKSRTRFMAAVAMKQSALGELRTPAFPGTTATTSWKRKFRIEQMEKVRAAMRIGRVGKMRVYRSAMLILTKVLTAAQRTACVG